MSESVVPRLFVLDTSVAIKWYLPEERDEEARELLSLLEAGEIELLAPDTIQPEFFNAIWQQYRRDVLERKRVWSIWEWFVEAPVSFFEIDPLMSRAARIAYETGVIVYDALFLALAENAETIMITDDNRLLRTLEGTPFASHARFLGEMSEST